jgi:hypothetical protein
MNNNFSITGYKDNSPDKNNNYNVIPGRSITMQGVSRPLTLVPIVNGQPQYDRKMTANPGDPDIDFEEEVEGVLELPFNQYGGMTGLLNPYNFQNAMYPVNNLNTALDYGRGIAGNSYAENNNPAFQNPYASAQANQVNPQVQPTVDDGDLTPISIQPQGVIMPNNQTVQDDNLRQQQEALNIQATNQQNKNKPFIGAINPYGGWNMENTATALGAFAQNKNILGTVASAGKLLLSGARNYFSGAAAAKNYNESLQQYDKKMQNAQRTQGWSWLQKGGTVGKLLTGNFIEGDENHPNPNTEVERGEYLQTPDGSTMEVLGDKHSDGGEMLNMPEGTKVISDYLKIGSKTAMLFKKQHDLNVKSSNSFATVLDKYKKKIGLTELLEEESKLMDKLDKQKDVKFEGTREINEQVLSEKINEIQGRKQDLENKFENFTNIVFDRQEQTKEPGESNFEKQKGGVITKEDYIKQNLGNVPDKYKNSKIDPKTIVDNLNNQEVFTGANLKPEWMQQRDAEFKQGYLYHASKDPNIKYENGKWVYAKQQGGEIEQQDSVDPNAQPVQQEPGSEIQQLIMSYAQITGQDPEALIQQLQQLPEDQLQAAIQQMMDAVQQSETPEQAPQDPNQEVQDVNAYADPNAQPVQEAPVPQEGQAPQMKRGGKTSARSEFVSEKIKILIDEGKKQDQAIAIAETMADNKFGKKAQIGTVIPRSDFDTLLANYTWNPSYSYGDTQAEAQAIIPFLQRNNVNFTNTDLATQESMDALAGRAQTNFRNSYQGVSNHYSSQVASTQQGLQTALDNGLVTQKQLKDLGVKIDKGQVLRGSKGLVPTENEQKLVGIITKNGKDKPDAYNKYVDNNFVDNKWYYRNPNIQSVGFDNQKEVDDYIKKGSYDLVEDSSGNKIYYSNKQGLYFNPVVKGEPAVATEDKGKTPEPAPTNTGAPIPRPTNRDRNFDNGLPLQVPDQSNLPPNYLPTSLRQIGSVQANPIAISPEETLKELNRQYTTSSAMAAETNPYTSGAMQASLQAQTNNATNQAYSQAAVANAQDQRNVENINEERILQRDSTNLGLMGQYEKEAITGLDNYVQSWRNYIDKRNLENVNNWNLENQRQAFNAVNDNFKIGSMGWYQTDEEPNIYMPGMYGLPTPYGIQRTKQTSETTRTNPDGSKVKNKSETTSNPRKQKGGLLLSSDIKNWLK